MPPKENKQNKGVKGKKKRKQISPLFDSTHPEGLHSEETGYTGGVSGSDNVTISKRKKNTQENKQENKQEERFLFDTQSIQMMNNMSTPNNIQNMQNVSYAHQQYPGQLAPSPTGQYQFPPQIQTPPWAIDIMKELQTIKQKVDKIDKIEQTVTTINQKLTEMDTKIKEIDKRVNEVENNASFLSNKYEEQSKILKSSSDKIKEIETKRKDLEQSIQTMQEKHDDLRTRALDSEYRSMRDNLIFFGLPETSDQTPRTDGQQCINGSADQEFDICEKMIKEFISTKLDINASEMIFDRAHRLGNKGNGRRPRPIIVKFHYFRERELVREASLRKREALKAGNFGVSVQIPKEWRETRQKLSQVYKNEKERGNRVKFVGEKLFINGSEYKPPHSQEI